MVSANITAKVKSLPRTPGCYLFMNRNGKVIYVGKAKNLRNRVGSYFLDNLNPDTKTYALVQKIEDISYIQVASEIEAFILEAELIKKYRPKYNIVLKDDKSYIYIIIRRDKIKISSGFVSAPVVLTARKGDLLKNDVVFGPFPNSGAAKQVVRSLRKMFPFRDCGQSKFIKYSKLKKPCLYGYISVCPAPCVYRQKKDLAEYRRNILGIKDILSGKGSTVIKRYKNLMDSHSIRKEYEAAAKYRDLIKKFDYVRQSFTSAEMYMDNPYFVEDQVTTGLRNLEKLIPIIKKYPKRIECYDVSNISGKFAVGSMVVFLDGKPENSEYRRFKIKTKDTPDDYWMMKEVLRRRFKREFSKSEKIKKWGLPDLLVLDGGRGQVGAGLEVLREVDLDIPVLGLAKKLETVVFFYRDEFRELNLVHGDLALKILIKLRDEAHRFAQRYHQLLRIKSLG